MVKGSVHRLVANTAKEMAGAFYEEAAHDNEFYRYYPNQGFFIQREWHRFVQAARSSLTEMLTRPSTTQFVKDTIFEALQLDGACNAPQHMVDKAIKDGSMFH